MVSRVGKAALHRSFPTESGMILFDLDLWHKIMNYRHDAPENGNGEEK